MKRFLYPSCSKMIYNRGVLWRRSRITWRKRKQAYRAYCIYRDKTSFLKTKQQKYLPWNNVNTCHWLLSVARKPFPSNVSPQQQPLSFLLVVSVSERICVWTNKMIICLLTKATRKLFKLERHVRTILVSKDVVYKDDTNREFFSEICRPICMLSVLSYLLASMFNFSAYSVIAWCRTGLRRVSDNRSRSRCRLSHLVGGQHDHLIRPVDGLTGDGQRVRLCVDRSLLHVVLGTPTHRRRLRRILRQTAPPHDVVESGRVLLFGGYRLQHMSPFIIICTPTVLNQVDVVLVCLSVSVRAKTEKILIK